MAYESVTGRWIKQKLHDFNLKAGNLVSVVKENEPRIWEWISETRSPSDEAKALMHFYFKDRENDLEGSTINLPTMHFIPVRDSSTGHRFIITWTHENAHLVVNRSDIDEYRYAETNKYKFLLLNPENYLYTIKFRIDTSNGFELTPMWKSDSIKDVEVIYGYK